MEQTILLAQTTYPTPVSVTVGMSPYTVQLTDKLLHVDTSSGPVTINLPNGTGRFPTDIAIKDITGNASTNPITVTPVGGETVDGLSPYLMDGAFSYVNFRPKSGGGYAVQN